MRYTRLTDEQKDSVKESTILQVEQEHYANQLALQRAEAVGNEVNVAQIKQNLADLEKQHEALIRER